MYYAFVFWYKLLKNKYITYIHDIDFRFSMRFSKYNYKMQNLNNHSIATLVNIYEKLFNVIII